MSLLAHNIHRQMAGFVVATLGWILSMTSMGLADWRVWYVDRMPPFPPGVACVGMWKVCIYRHAGDKKDIACHLYSYADTYLPLDIRVAQSLLLAAGILGLLAKWLVVSALRHVFVGNLQKDTVQRLFITSAVLKVTAGAGIAVAVVCNYGSVIMARGIAFPPSFTLPFKPEAQQVGGACIMAVLAAFVMLLSGLLSFPCRLSPKSQVHPALLEL